MDTFEVKVESPMMARALVEFLRGAEWSPIRDLHGRYEAGDGPRVRLPAGYNGLISGHLKEKFLYCLTWGPSRDNPQKAVFGAHLSSFNNIEEFYSWLDLFGPELGDYLGTSPLRRLDICVDIKVPFETVASLLTNVRARKVTRYEQNGRSTLYIGTRPRQTYAYSKSVPIYDQVPAVVSPQTVDGTRIEVRFFGKKLPIQSLDELPHLYFADVFGHLQLLEIDDAVLAALPPSKMHLIRSFKWRAAEVGLQQARREFNQNKNFHRDIGRYLLPSSRMNLEEAFLSRCQRWF